MQDNDRIATNLGLMSSTFGSVFQAERSEGGATVKREDSRAPQAHSMSVGLTFKGSLINQILTRNISFLILLFGNTFLAEVAVYCSSMGKLGVADSAATARRDG